MSPVHTRRGSKLYRYRVCQAALKGETTNARSRACQAVVGAPVINQVRILLKSPEFVVAARRAVKSERVNLAEAMVASHWI